MGAWGYDVFANDEACDFLEEIIKPLWELANEKTLRKFEYDRVRAAAEVVISLSGEYKFDPKLASQLKEHLDNILADSDWVEGWDQPDLLKKDLRRQINSLKKGLTHE